MQRSITRYFLTDKMLTSNIYIYIDIIQQIFFLANRSLKSYQQLYEAICVNVFFWHVVTNVLWYKNCNACPKISKKSCLWPESERLDKLYTGTPHTLFEIVLCWLCTDFGLFIWDAVLEFIDIKWYNLFKKMTPGDLSNMWYYLFK